MSACVFPHNRVRDTMRVERSGNVQSQDTSPLRSCNARGMDYQNTYSRVTCGTAEVDVKEYPEYDYYTDNVTLSQSCHSTPLACFCVTKWGAQDVCGNAGTFSPTGNDCSIYIDDQGVTHRRRGVGAGYGARIQALCLMTTTTSTSTSFSSESSTSTSGSSRSSRSSSS
eukprot:5340362-Amphidinium_carterae.1